MIERDADQTSNSCHRRQRPVHDGIALKRAGESGTETSQSHAHRKAESVTQTASVTRCVFRDQAVVDRLVHEMNQRQEAGGGDSIPCSCEGHPDEKWNVAECDPRQLPFENGGLGEATG